MRPRAGERRHRRHAGRAQPVPAHARHPRAARGRGPQDRGAARPRLRAILINSPHNPSATIWTAEEMRQLEDLLAPTDILLISDEVYEHMVFDGAEHQSAARFAGLAARAFIVSSFGKTFHVTGWKVG